MIMLGSSAPELRRELGPNAWVVLEDLVTRARSMQGHVTVDASAASIVESVGLGRDCVRATLRRLAKAGVIVTSSAHDGHGRFRVIRGRGSPAGRHDQSRRRRQPEHRGTRPRSRVMSHDNSAGAGQPLAGQSASAVDTTSPRHRPRAQRQHVQPNATTSSLFSSPTPPNRRAPHEPPHPSHRQPQSDRRVQSAGPRPPATSAHVWRQVGERAMTVRVTTLKGGGIVNYLESQGVELVLRR